MSRPDNGTGGTIGPGPGGYSKTGVHLSSRHSVLRLWDLDPSEPLPGKHYVLLPLLFEILS